MTAVTGDRPVAAGNGSWARLARSEALRGFALVSPTFLYALLLLLAPILVIVAFSFWTQDYLTIDRTRSEEHTSELQSLMRNSYAVFCLQKKTIHQVQTTQRM